MFRCARKASILVRSSVMWIDLIIVFGPFDGLSGSSVNVGGPLCGADGAPASVRAEREASLPARSVGGESEVGLVASREDAGNSTVLLRASCSVGNSTVGSDG